MAKSRAVATIEPGATELACENKSELTQARSVSAIISPAMRSTLKRTRILANGRAELVQYSGWLAMRYGADHWPSGDAITS